MIKRREFLAASSLTAIGLHLYTSGAFAATKDIKTVEHRDPGMILVRDGMKRTEKEKKKNISPLLREEILDNPRAVFVIESNVTSQHLENGRFPAEKEQMERAGYKTAQKIFRKGTTRGGLTYIKPNYVGGFSDNENDLNNGTSTHPSFVAGFSDALSEMGNTNVMVQANGAVSHETFAKSGICEMMDDHKIIFVEGRYQDFSKYIPEEITWVDYPDGIVMRKIPFFNPVLDKDTTFINMAKDRIHQLGITTLTIKNLQGIMPVGFMHICRGWGTVINEPLTKASPEVYNPDYQRAIEQLYKKHANMGYKYWDEDGATKAYYDEGGWEAYQKEELKPHYHVFWGEQWGERIMDIATNITPTVNLVEGIFGIDMAPRIHLNNFITISQSMVACDSVAAWLMGHDPRELPYLRIANERGMGENDIEKIQIYKITGDDVVRVKDYRDFPRARMGVYIYSYKNNGLRFF